MANLYLICGAPGSGKSTYLKNTVDPKTAKIISRDKIRFSMLKPGEDYFSHEDEVKKKFWKEINDSLNAGFDTYVDQTSLTPTARGQVLYNVTAKPEKTIAIWICTKLSTCLKRNENRKGTKAYVPRNVIKDMYNRFSAPTKQEGFDIIEKHIND